MARKYKHICIGIEIFTNGILSANFWGEFKPISNRDVLRTGYYGNVYDCKIWVSKHMPPDTISISNLEIIEGREESKWSPPIAIEDSNEYKKIINLKAFW